MVTVLTLVAVAIWALVVVLLEMHQRGYFYIARCGEEREFTGEEIRRIEAEMRRTFPLDPRD